MPGRAAMLTSRRAEREDEAALACDHAQILCMLQQAKRLQHKSFEQVCRSKSL